MSAPPNLQQIALRMQGERPVIRREFTWRDHVNDYWDEAEDRRNRRRAG